ncbi:hypothetical protein, variant 5 [Aphanomyces astaci]|nr:hypothetical protein, variant 5 [Aphanomyces astaci]ETV71288.1 hypothetical protein, variant 5 [Aphanomyces astaci]|eukprot:XP_009839225.1 hypothetical protein, variant 5 [Aphanomyces astaci]
MESNPNYDLRNLLYGTHGVLMAVVSAWTSEVWPQLDGIGVRLIPIPPSTTTTRRHIQSCMDVPGLVFGLISHADGVVAFKQGLPDHPLPIEDVHVLLHILQHMPSFRTSESWTPLCLPTFNRGGFLYGYVLFVSNGMSVLLLSNDQSQSQFHAFQTQTRRVLEPLLLQTFETSPTEQDTVIPTFVMSATLPRTTFEPLLLHYFYQSYQTHEYLSPPFEDSSLSKFKIWHLLFTCNWGSILLYIQNLPCWTVQHGDSMSSDCITHYTSTCILCRSRPSCWAAPLVLPPHHRRRCISFGRTRW